MCALNQQVFLKLSHRRNDLHGHLSGRAGEVYAAQREAVHAYIRRCQLFNCLPHVHCVATQAIKFGHYQHIAIFHTIK
ncbi:hypothetical protein D3C87_1957690 [compost metagenome]